MKVRNFCLNTNLFKNTINKRHYKFFCENFKKKVNFSSDMFSDVSNYKLKSVRTFPINVEKKAQYEKDIEELQEVKFEENLENELFDIYNLYENDNSYIFSEFKLNSKFLDRPTNPAWPKFSKDSETHSKLVKEIDISFSRLQYNFTEDLSPYRDCLNNYLKAFENESIETNLKEVDRVINYLKNARLSLDSNSREYNLLEYLSQEIIIKKLNILDKVEDLHIIKSSFNFLAESVFFHSGERDKEGKPLNYKGFEAILKGVLENLVVRMIKNSSPAVDLCNMYSLLALYYLKKFEWDKSEDYLAKGLEKLRTSEYLKTTNDKSPLILIYFIQSRICLRHHKDMTETYNLLNECYNIISKIESSSDEQSKPRKLHEIFVVDIYLDLLTILVELEGYNPKKTIELVDYLSKCNFPLDRMSSLNLLISLGEVNKNLGYFRKAYNFYQSALRISYFDQDLKDNVVTSLLDLYKYSDDFNIYSKKFSEFTEDTDPNLSNLKKNLAENFLKLSILSLEMMDLTNCRTLLDTLQPYIKNSWEVNEQFKTRYYSTLALLNFECGDEEAAVENLLKSIELIENSKKIDKYSQIRLLLTYNLELAKFYIYSEEEEDAIKCLENFIQLTTEMRKFRTPESLDLACAIELSANIFQILALYYKSEEEATSLSLQSKRIDEFLKIMDPKDPRVKYFSDQMKKVLI
jgi:hypothetical protein